MPPPPTPLVWDCFSELPDPRRAQGRRHKLLDILAISRCAVLCGADDFTEIEKFAAAVRGHWAVENSCHWVLDVAFREDDSRVRVGHAAENFALLRRLVNNLLQHERSVKRGVRSKRLTAALDENYLLKVLRL